MSKSKKKYIISLVLVIAILFGCTVGLALLLKNVSDSKKVPVRDNDVVLSAETTNVKIKGIVSVSSDFGKTIHENNNGAFGYLPFEIVNTTGYDRGYQVIVTQKNSEIKDINSSYITMYLTDASDKPMSGYQSSKLPSYTDLHYLSDKPDSKVLYSGLVKGNDKKQFILRVWIADNFVIQNEELEFIFDISVRAV